MKHICSWMILLFALTSLSGCPSPNEPSSETATSETSAAEANSDGESTASSETESPETEAPQNASVSDAIKAISVNVSGTEYTYDSVLEFLNCAIPASTSPANKSAMEKNKASLETAAGNGDEKVFKETLTKVASDISVTRFSGDSGAIGCLK